MPFWDRSIDLLVMTHPDADHITGLVEVLARYRIHGWLDNGSTDEDAVFGKCQDLLNEAGVPRHTTRAGDRLELGRGLVLEVLHPSVAQAVGIDADANNDSVVLRLVWDHASFLLTGDVEAEGERLLLQSGQSLSAAVLKVGHHGSNDSSTAEFMAAVDPGYAVISVGIDNPFGHPEQALLDRLAQQDNLTILRTDEQGTIEFATDGQRLWIRTEH
jgi:competence protein ComEC